MGTRLSSTEEVKKLVKEVDAEDCSRDFIEEETPEVCPLCLDPECEHDCLYLELVGESHQEDLQEYNNSTFDMEY